MTSALSEYRIVTLRFKASGMWSVLDRLTLKMKALLNFEEPVTLSI